MNVEGTLILTRQDIAALMSFNDYVVAVEEAFRLYVEGKTQLPAVVDIDGQDGAFHIKAAGMELQQTYVAVKVNGNFPQNGNRFGLPTIQGAILLYDGVTGYPLAFMDSIEITINRTGAATILAAKYLARPDSTTVTICGCGNQGRVSLVGLKQVLPLKRAYAFDVNEDAARIFSEQMTAQLGIPVTPIAALSEAVSHSDVIVTCTTARRYFLSRGDVPPGAFIAAVGADSHDKQELDPHLLISNKIVVDILEQCATIGELHHAIARGLISRADVYAELGEIIAGRTPGRTSREEIIIFDSTGTAIQDVAAAAAVYERAKGKGVGASCNLA
jgi:ornithine cyclodeaminase/alanine dehydrogenase